jgi:hypothetical protein
MGGSVNGAEAAGVGPGLLLALDAAAFSITAIPFWLLLTGHSFSVLQKFRGFTPYWLVSWWTVFLAGFGGGTISALLLQVSFVDHRIACPARAPTAAPATKADATTVDGRLC